MCKEALAVAKRPEERRQVLGVLGDVKNLDALKLAATCLEDADCKEEAAAAAVKIAGGLPPNQGQEAKPILEKAIAVSGNKTVKDDAAQVLKKLGQP
jgi:HEAT repeat protein